MSMEYLSIYFCHPQFLSLMSSVYRYFISFIKFIPGYFILFGVILNGIVFLISLSESLLLMYRNAIDFCMLILYSATLLNLFISSNSFFGGIFWAFYIYDYVSCEQRYFYFCLLNLDSSYFFFLFNCSG